MVFKSLVSHLVLIRCFANYVQTKQKNAISEDVLRVQSATSRATGTSPVQKSKAAAKDQSLHVPAGKRGSALKHAESSADVGESHVRSIYLSNHSATLYMSLI